MTGPEFMDWADAWVRDNLSHSLLPIVKELEQRHSVMIRAAFGRFFDQLEVEYSALAGLIDRINSASHDDWPSHRAIQYGLVAYNARTFISAVDRLDRGYYDDAITLTRSLYETFIRVLFVSCFKDTPYNPLVHKPPKGEGPQFNLTNFLRDDLKVDWATKYRIMSGFAHSNGFEIIQAMQRASEREGEPERFGPRIEYREDLAVASIAFITFVLLAHLRVINDLCAGQVPAEDKALAADAIRLLTISFEENEKNYWRTAVADLDLLIRMVPVADAGGDNNAWREFLASEREASAS